MDNNNIDLGSKQSAIMIYPDRDISQALAIPGGLPFEQLHCTVLYLGDVRDLPDFDEIITRVSDVESPTPITLPIKGLHVFPEGDNGFPVVILLQPSLALSNYREQLLENGVPDSSTYAYRPHLTLGYAEDEKDGLSMMALARAYLPSEINFTNTMLSWDNEYFDLDDETESLYMA